MTLLASPSYQGLPPRLVSSWMSCPLDVLQLLANPFALSFLDLLASKLLACPGDCLATHVVAKQLCRKGPGMWTEASVQKCFKIFLIYVSETFLGRVRGGVPTWFPLWAEHSSSQHWCRQVTGHFTFLWFTACLLVLGWQMHSVCVWVHNREDQQLMDLNHTRRGSLPLCNVSIAWGEIAEY